VLAPLAAKYRVIRYDARGFIGRNARLHRKEVALGTRHLLSCFADEVGMDYTELLVLGGHYAALINRDTDLTDTGLVDTDLAGAAA
jgi:hypothetical protein